MRLSVESEGDGGASSSPSVSPWSRLEGPAGSTGPGSDEDVRWGGRVGKALGGPVCLSSGGRGGCERGAGMSGGDGSRGKLIVLLRASSSDVGAVAIGFDVVSESVEKRDCSAFRPSVSYKM